MNKAVFFWGDLTTAFIPQENAGKSFSELSSLLPFSTIVQKLSLEALVVLKQVHGIDGVVITVENRTIPFWTVEGDYLITKKPGVGIGVVTADCLPVIFVDQVTGTVAVAHAGWKGLFGGIVEVVIDRLTGEYGVGLSDLKVFVGPAARGCCYEITPEFMEYIPREGLSTSAIKKRNDLLFFDLVTFLREIILRKGLKEAQFDCSSVDCTICSGLFCSSRKQNRGPLRQLSVVTLK